MAKKKKRKLNFNTVATDTNKTQARVKQNTANYRSAVRTGEQARLASKGAMLMAKSGYSARAATKKRSMVNKTTRSNSPHAQKQLVYTPNAHKSESNVSKGVKKAQGDAMVNTVAGRAYLGAVNNTLLLGTLQTRNKKLLNSKAYRAGQIAGDIASYATGYGAAGKALAKAGVKVAASKAGRKTVAKLASGEVAQSLAKNTLKKQGRKITKNAIKKQATRHAENAVKLVAKNAIGDATVGATLDTARARANGVKTKEDYAKYMAKNAVLNTVTGGAVDVLPVLKGLKGEKQAVAKLAKGKQKYFKKSVEPKTNWVTKDLKTGKARKVTTENVAQVKKTNKPTSTFETALEAKGKPAFKKYLNDNGISVVKYAKANNKKNSEAIAELYTRYKHENKAAERVSNGSGATAQTPEINIPKAKKVYTANKAELKNNTDKILDKYFIDKDVHGKNTQKYISQLHDELNSKVPDEVRIDRIADEAADNIVDEARYSLDDEDIVGDEVKAIAADLRNRKIVVAKGTAAELNGKGADGFNAYRKENFGKLNIAKRNKNIHGVESGSLDGQYEELQQLYGKGFFPDADSQQEMIEHINAVLAEAEKKPQTFEIPAESREDIKKILKGELIDAAKKTGTTKQAVERETNKIPPLFEKGSAADRAIKTGKTQEEAEVAFDISPMANEKAKPQMVAMKAGDSKLSVKPAYTDNGELAQVSTTSPKDRVPLKERFKEAFLKFKEKWTDTAESVYQLGKKADDKLLYPYLDRARSAKTYAEQMVGGDKQVVKLSNGKTLEGDSLQKIFKPIMEDDTKYKDFQDYMFNKENIYRMSIDRPVYGAARSAEESEKIANDLLKKNPEFNEWAEKIYNYQHNLMEMRVDSGQISRELADYMEMTNPYYVPTHRMGNQMNSNGQSTFGNTLNTKTGLYKSKGSNYDLVPLHDQLINSTFETVHGSATNDFGVRLMKDLPNDVMSVSEVTGKDISKEFIDDIDNGTPMKQIEQNGDNYIFNVRQGGKVYQVNIDKHLFNAVDALTKPVPRSVVTRFNGIFRTAVTSANPLFAVRNGLRDFFDAPSFTKYGTRSFYKNYPKAWKLMLGNSDMWKLYNNLGGTSGSFIDIRNDFKPHNWLLRNTFDRIEAMNQYAEQSARFTEFLSSLERNGNSKDAITQALNDAHDITVNFGRGGSWGKTINANGGTFFNAGIQDIVRMSRALQEHRYITLVKGAAVLGVAPSVINEMLYKDNEYYQDLRQSDKDVNFVYYTGDGNFIKIPKGRIMSVIGMPFQRATRAALGNADGDTFKGMGGTVMNQIAPVNPLTNNIFAPAIEAAKSKGGQTWYGSDIIPTSLANKPANQQTDENTTTVANAIANTGFGKALKLSPKRLDYAFKQYSGVVGQVGMPLVTPAAKGNILKRNFMIDAVTNNGTSTKFYDRLTKAVEKKSDNNATYADGMEWKYLNKGSKELSELNKKVAKVQASTSLSDSEKLEKVRDIRRKMSDIEKDYLDNADLVKNASKEVASKVKKSDYATESAYKKDMWRQTSIKVFGADQTLKEELGLKYPKKAKALKKAGLSADTYYKAYSAMSKLGGNNYYARAAVAIKNGVKSYSQLNAVQSNFYESTYYKTKRLIDMGFTPEKIAELTDKSAKKKIDANGNNALSGAEIVNYLNSKGYSQEKKRKLFALYAPSNWRNPF